MKKIFILGQSLFEVMFAIGIASLVLIAIVSLSTRSVKNSDFSRNNSLASKYAQEGAEWVRQERDTSTDWSTFVTGRTGSDIQIGNLSWSGGGNPITNTIFNRFVRMDLDLVDPNIANVTVKVTWEDGSGQHEVSNSTKLTNWRM